MRLRQPRFVILLVCWIGIISAGDFADIVWQVLLHGSENSLWIPAIQLAGLFAVTALSFSLPSLRPARGFIMALLAFAAGNRISWVIEGTNAWLDAVASLPVEYRMIARAVLSLIPASLMFLTLSGSGLGRKDIFVSRGNLRAESAMPFGIRAVRWTVLGPALTVIFVLPLVLQLTLTLHPDFSTAARAMRALPAILAFAALNAASEEFRFRSVLVARIHPVVGTGQTLLMTSALFGLAHWFGHPSGPTGVLLAGFAGWFWGKAMIETKGFAWSWLIHAAQDAAIVAFIIMAAR